MKETNSHVSAIEQLLFTNEHEPSPSFFCLDTKKRSKKKSRLARFRYLYLSIPKQNETPFGQTAFCF